MTNTDFSQRWRLEAQAQGATCLGSGGSPFRLQTAGFSVSPHMAWRGSQLSGPLKGHSSHSRGCHSPDLSTSQQNFNMTQILSPLQRFYVEADPPPPPHSRPRRIQAVVSRPLRAPCQGLACEALSGWGEQLSNSFYLQPISARNWLLCRLCDKGCYLAPAWLCPSPCALLEHVGFRALGHPPATSRPLTPEGSPCGG